MFTGIITDVAKVRKIHRTGDTRFEFTSNIDTHNFEVGASIACSGTCLTIIEYGNNWFATNVSEETLSKTTMVYWEVGTPVNIERPLKASDELGGHIVSGHIDGTGKVSSIKKRGDSIHFWFQLDKELMKFIAIKGSVAVDGVSLTINDIIDNKFSVNVIPHTQFNTTFGVIRIGDDVNVEVDMLARYLARFKEME